jgi:hypothetical protein
MTEATVLVTVDGFSELSGLLIVWLGGLDSIEEQIRNPTKNGKN